MDEREAVAKLKRGDIGGLEVLARAYQLKATRAADLIVRDRSLAEDIVAETLLHIYERIEQFDVSRPFGPWFLRCVINAAREAATQRERHVPLSGGQGDLEQVLASPMPGPEALAERAELRFAVWAALGRLSPAERAAVVQRYYLGLSEQEMAAESGCSPGTIKWRLHQARERLRHWLRPLWGAASAEGFCGPQEIEIRKEVRL